MNVTLQCIENRFFIVSYTMWQAATSPNETHLLTKTSTSDMELLELTQVQLPPFQNVKYNIAHDSLVLAIPEPMLRDCSATLQLFTKMLSSTLLHNLNPLLDLLLWAQLVAVSTLLLPAIHSAGVKACVAPSEADATAQ
jgi:hypothetical protein